MTGRSQTPPCSFLIICGPFRPVYLHTFPYNAKARTNPPTMASPPVAILPAAALADGDGALLDVDKEPPDDVCVGLGLAIERVVERVLFELG
jgi:hypothetical protein